MQGDLLLVMVDPDAPAPEPCPDKYWLHWLAQVKVEVGQFVWLLWWWSFVVMLFLFVLNYLLLSAVAGTICCSCLYCLLD